MIGVWCAMSELKIIGSIFCLRFDFIQICDMFWYFFEHQMMMRGRITFFEQDTTTSDLIYNCMHPLHNVFGESNKQRIVASSFVRSEPMQFIFVLHVKGESIQEQASY